MPAARVLAARKFQLLPKAGRQPPPPAPEPTGQAPGNGANGTSGSPTNGTNGHQPSGPEAPVQDQLQFLQVAPSRPAQRPAARAETAQGAHGERVWPIARVQDKAQYFPQDPSQQPFPPYSTDPKVTASVQVPLKVEVERRKRLFANQDIMYFPAQLHCIAEACRCLLFGWLTREIVWVLQASLAC